jgi:hypothetical protein
MSESTGERDVMTDAEYEAITRRYFAAREPGCEIAISVRRGDRVVRFVLLSANDNVTLRLDGSSESGPAA